MPTFSLYVSCPIVACFDNENTNDPPVNDPQAPTTTDDAISDLGDPDPELKKFTQADVNRFLAEDKRKHQVQLKKLESQMTSTLEKATMSEEERARLEESLEDVRKQLRTKEEQAKYEKKQLEDQYRQQLEEAQTRANSVETKFQDMLITRSIQDAAVSGDVFNPEQTIAILKPLTKLVEDKPMVDFPDVAEETGEPIVTQMTPEDAIKRMKQLPEKYGNLFKTNVVSGIGGASNTGVSPGNNGQIDVRKLTTEQYIKIRKENPALLGLKPKN